MDKRIQYPFKNDHEFLIALIQDFNSSIASLDSRMKEDHQDTVEIKALLKQQYDTLSRRIEEVEKSLLEIKPEDISQMKKDVENNKRWIADFNRTKHIAWIIASAGFVFMGYYIPNIIRATDTLFKFNNH